MTSKTTQQKTPVLKIERVFNTTPERLWSFWTDPKKYAKWLNPAPIDLVVHEFDVRPGGKVRFDMPQPDGNKNPQEGVFHSLTPHKEIVTGAPDKSFLITVRFAPVDPTRTRMTVEVTGVLPEYHAMATKGWNAGFDKLERLLGPGKVAKAKATSTIVGRSVRIERIFKAPPGRLWAAFSTPWMLEKWFWPGVMGKVEKLDFRVGGRLVMAAIGQPWKATWEWVELEVPRRIVFRDHWDDGSGHVATGTIDFEAVPEGTRMVVTFGPFPTTGPYKLEDAAGGFTATTEKLAALVEPAEEPQGFTIERTFKATPEKVWAMWATREGIQKWWVLSAREMGYDMKVREMDVRVGGKFAFELKGKEHTVINRGTYRTVQPHRKLAWTWHFDIFLGPGEEPYDVPITVELEPVPDGTKMTFTQGPLATSEFTEGSRQGVLSNLDKLEKALQAK